MTITTGFDLLGILIMTYVDCQSFFENPTSIVNQLFTNKYTPHRQTKTNKTAHLLYFESSALFFFKTI
jgi:hypothetical protein